MLSHTIREVYIAQHSVDFRKGAAALLAEAVALELDPYKGECLVFIHKSRRKIRVLAGDALGLWLLERRFDAGKLESQFEFMQNPAISSITAAELAMLLEGNAFIVNKRPKKWRP
jgi:hypothetical protein